jgi:hypothetical protein
MYLFIISIHVIVYFAAEEMIMNGVGTRVGLICIYVHRCQFVCFLTFVDNQSKSLDMKRRCPRCIFLYV